MHCREGVEGERGQLELTAVAGEQDWAGGVEGVVAEATVLSGERCGDAEATAGQSYLAGLGVGLGGGLDEEGAFDVVRTNAALGYPPGESLLGRGGDLAVRMAVVQERNHGLEELLEVGEVDDLLGGELVDEPAHQAAVVSFNLALPLGRARLDGVAVHTELGEALAEDLGLEGGAEVNWKRSASPHFATAFSSTRMAASVLSEGATTVASTLRL